MKRLAYLAGIILGVSALALQAQQTDGDAGTGFPQNGVFAGSSIESVQINNGNLHVEIPVWSYTGRGGVESGVSFVYDSKGWELFQLQQGTNFTNDIIPETGNTLQLALYTKGSAPTITHQLYGAGNRQTFSCNGTTYPYEYLYAFVVREPNGTKHHLVPDNVTGHESDLRSRLDL